MSSVSRRETLSLVAVVALGLSSGRARAASWPTRPVKLIVTFAPGGGTDLVARMLAPRLSDRLGQPVIVENRAGANGITGMQAVVTAKDEHTFGVISAGPLVVNPHIYKKLPYDPLKDFAPISLFGSFPLLLAISPSIPASNVKEFVAYAKAKAQTGGLVSYSSPGIGNTNHLAGELFASLSGVPMLHVPYKGSAPAVAALLSGEVDSTFSSIPTILPHVQNGRVKVLGVGNANRIPFLPSVPTIAEGGVPGYEAVAWGGVVGPAGLPAHVVTRMHTELVSILKQKDIYDQLTVQGAVPLTSTPEEFEAYIRSELTKWGDIVRRAKITPEN